MKLPINNRVIAKTRLSKYSIDQISESTGLSNQGLTNVIKRQLVNSFASEVINNVEMSRINAVGVDQQDIEYTLESYVFTERQLREYVEDYLNFIKN